MEGAVSAGGELLEDIATHPGQLCGRQRLPAVRVLCQNISITHVVGCSHTSA